MTYKRWIAGFLGISIAFLCLFGGFTYLADPLVQFRADSPILTYYEYLDSYSNPGIAKNYDYDAVLVGTSMVQNTNVAECNRLFGCDMVRLAYSGGTACNMRRILDLCFASHNTVNTVYWELDQMQLLQPFDQPVYPLPEYLYEEDSSGSLSYLLNLDVFYKFTLPSIRATLNGEVQPAAREGNLLSGDFCAETALASYTRAPLAQEKLPENAYYGQIQANLDHNLLPLIRQNPDTEFVFFFVPFSMLYWDYEIRHGSLDACLSGTFYAIDQLLDYDNVSLYFYHDQWEIATNLDNYKDYSHYGPWINSYVSEQIALGNGLLTKDNCETVLRDMKRYLESYDFEGLFA